MTYYENYYEKSKNDPAPNAPIRSKMQQKMSISFFYWSKISSRKVLIDIKNKNKNTSQ